jgi:hypothetical protein
MLLTDTPLELSLKSLSVPTPSLVCPEVLFILADLLLKTYICLFSRLQIYLQEPLRGSLCLHPLFLGIVLTPKVP